MKEKRDILIVGVGGQGIILASEILSDAGMEAGFEVKKSEVHGMSQRGGSVSTHIRFGPRVFSPLIRQGEADFLLAFEMLEALRWVHFLCPEGIIIVNKLKINPTTVSSGFMEYPPDIERLLDRSGHKVQCVEGLKLAEQAGSPKAMNNVLLGAISNYLPEIPEELWLRTIGSRVPPKTRKVNEQAFSLGRHEGRALKDQQGRKKKCSQRVKLN
ncbi:MAG: indolepyruvate oxidoreductase subunit beta [bacterium]